MLEDARAGLFSHVAVENAECFGHNDTEALVAIDQLHKLGIAIRFADYPDLDPIDPDDHIFVSLSFTLARRESIKLGQRVRGGLHVKLRSGGFVGRVPDGYINCEEKSDQVDPDLIPLIRDSYTDEMGDKLGRMRPDKRADLERKLKEVDDKEARALRLYTMGKISERVWDNM